LAVLFATPDRVADERLMRSVAELGVAAARFDGDADDLEAAMATLRRRYRIDQGAAHALIGADATERWTGREFRAFAARYFDRDSAWTYVPLERHVVVEAGGRLAWFDEVLDNAGYGECRGTGVLALRDGRWVLRQYNLTVPVPNDLMAGVAKQIRAFEQAR
jgi:hypothetical protein